MRTDRLLSLASRLQNNRILEKENLSLIMRELLAEIEAELVYLAKDADPLLRQYEPEKASPNGNAEIHR